jgi:hypothetical protein
MPYNTFSGLARDVFTTEFDSDTTITTFSQISGWFAASVGSLNNLINTSFSGADPEIDEEARAIFQSMYLAGYYERQARNAARGVISSANGENILSVSDGDNKIQFANRSEIAKTFRGMATDAANAAERAADKYCMYGARPQSINGLDMQVTGYAYASYYSL